RPDPRRPHRKWRYYRRSPEPGGEPGRAGCLRGRQQGSGCAIIGRRPARARSGRSKERSLDFPIAVNGTLMRGLELNPRILAVGGRFDRETTTAPHYRLWSIDDRHPAMIRVREGGVAV